MRNLKDYIFESATANTEFQENLTCEIFNDILIDNGKKSVDSDDLETLKEKYNGDPRFSTYITSCKLQAETLKKVLIVGGGWENLIAVRYPNDTDTVLKKCKELLDDVTKQFSKSRGVIKKDSINPSDIIVYNKNKIDTILCVLNGVIYNENIDTEGTLYITEYTQALRKLIETKSLISVSLKKDGNGFKPNFINVNKENDFDTISINEITISDRGISIDATCKGENRNEKDLSIAIRTSSASSNNVRFLPKLKGRDSQIGDCPKYVYRECFKIPLNEYFKMSISNNWGKEIGIINKFIEDIEKNKKQLNDAQKNALQVFFYIAINGPDTLKVMLLSSEKSGDYFAPYLLLEPK